MIRIFGMAAALAAAAALSGCVPETTAKEEKPDFVVASAEAAFEIRDYGPQLWAQHAARGTYRSAVEQGYIRLERYFTGENTVPEAIPMSAPVMVREDHAEGWTTMFPMPDAYTAESAPRPVDRRIRVVELPPRRVAAVRFRGQMGESVLREKAAELDAWLTAQGLAHRGDFTLASHDPPWKPAAWRRNEVLVTLRQP